MGRRSSSKAIGWRSSLGRWIYARGHRVTHRDGIGPEITTRSCLSRAWPGLGTQSWAGSEGLALTSSSVGMSSPRASAGGAVEGFPALLIPARLESAEWSPGRSVFRSPCRSCTQGPAIGATPRGMCVCTQGCVRMEYQVLDGGGADQRSRRSGERVVLTRRVPAPPRRSLGEGPRPWRP